MYLSVLYYLFLIVIFGGKLAYAQTPSVLDRLQPGHWYEVPNSHIESVFPSNRPPGNTGPRSVIDAWSGGAYDSDRDRLIVWGGGHCDYSGNEVYVFDINRLQWSRLTDPSSPVAEGGSYYPDGLPASKHTYNTLEYLPGLGKLISVSNSGYWCSGTRHNVSATDLFNFHTNRWERGAMFPPLGNSSGAAAAYDSATGALWFHGTYGEGKLGKYDPRSNTWSTYAGQYLSIYGTAAIDPNRHIMVLVGGYGGQRQLLVWDLSNPSQVPTSPNTSGASVLETSASVGFEFDPVVKKFVGWDGGTDVYTLDPDTWAWTKVSSAPSNTVNPGAPNSNGTYGRFRYIPSKNAYIVVNEVNKNVFFYKLTAGGVSVKPKPPINLRIK